MSEEGDKNRNQRRKEIRDEIDALLLEYVRIADMLTGAEMITNWVVLLPSAGMDDEGDDTSYVHLVMRDGQIPSWQLMGLLQHEMTTTQAMVTAREWGSSDNDE